MKGFAAIVFCGAIASCSRDMESSSGSATEKIEETYSKAFVTHFAQPAQDQTWGFGNAAAGTRANNPGTDVPYTSEAINANSNEWADPTPGKTYGGWVVPETLTVAQKELVRKYFQAVTNPTYEDPHYRHFFIQQVYKGHTNPPTTGNQELNKSASGAEYTSDNMNYLTVGHSEEHINNFNAGDCSYKNVGDNGYAVNDNKSHQDQISLMVNIDDTECFGYHNSGCSIQRNDKAALVHWTTIRTWARAQGIYTEDILNDKWDRSFMGFDFELLSLEDSYYKDNSGNPIYAKFSNGQLNNLQYVYYGPNDIRKRGSRPASTRRAGTRDGETSVNIWEGTDQIKYLTPKYFSLSDKAKELLVAGNYLGVDLSVVPEWYNNQWNYGTYTNWGIKLFGHWGEENGGRLDNGNFTLSANSTNVEMQLSESDVAILKQQNLTIYPTADPVDISRIYISNYSQANGGGSSSGTESGESQSGESQGGESQGGESQGGESQSDDNYEIYDSEYLIVNGEQIPFLIENKNMYGGVKYLNGDEMLKDADMTIEVDGKQCFNMAKIKELVDDGYLPVWNSNLRTWVKWGGGDGYYSDWIVTLTKASRLDEVPEGDEIAVIAEDLTINDAIPDFDFNDVVFTVKWNKTENKVNVTLLAAGGTLPLYIGGTDGVFTDGHEVHEEFASVNPDKVILTTTMINTAPNAHNAYKTPTFEVTNFNHSATTIGEIAKSIKVAVKKYGEMIELKAPQGGVPTKIAVKTDFVTKPEYGWCDEREDIDDKYNKDGWALFKSYVKGELDDNWYTNINPKKGNQ